LKNLIAYSFSLLNTSSHTLLLALFYIHKLTTTSLASLTSLTCTTTTTTSTTTTTPFFQSTNPDKLLLAGLILADIHLNDHPLSLKAWASVAGLPESSGYKELLQVKQKALEGVGYELNVPNGEYVGWLKSLEGLVKVMRKQW
jgi:hypothetical protein